MSRCKYLVGDFCHHPSVEEQELCSFYHEQQYCPLIKKKVKISKIYVFHNGNIIVFDDMGDQIPELQYNIITRCRKQGYEIDEDLKINC